MFHVATMLPLRVSNNMSWFINGNLVPLVERFSPLGWCAGQGKQLMHIDKAPAHNSRMAQNFFGHSSLKRLPHLFYSLDISPPDFSLFGRVNSALIGREILDASDLLKQSLIF
jgi:hypothetical protein